MPGPLSAKVTRTPRRSPFSSTSMIISPRSAYRRTLRASSLAAVTSLVCSTMPNPRSTAVARTRDRTVTSEASVSIVQTVSGLSTTSTIAGSLANLVQQRHPVRRVQRGLEMLHADAELHQSDRHRGLDAHHDDVGAEQADHAGQ